MRKTPFDKLLFELQEFIKDSLHLLDGETLVDMLLERFTEKDIEMFKEQLEFSSENSDA